MKVKKAKHILLILIFLANTNFATARGGDGLGLMFVILGGYGASILSSIPLAATPSLFKDEDTEYSYSKTLIYSMSFASVIPMVTLATGDIDIFFSSLVIAPILGTVLGFNASKKNKNTPIIYNKGKNGWYVGFDMGGNRTFNNYGLTYSAEMGYGITDNLLIHYSLEWKMLQEYEYVAMFGGIGASYYIKNYGYIKSMFSSSTAVLSTKNKSNSRKISIGYGYLVSEQKAIEFTYENFYFNDVSNLNASHSADVFSISINSRFF